MDFVCGKIVGKWPQKLKIVTFYVLIYKQYFILYM
jgi:hypothetical protein